MMAQSNSAIGCEGIEFEGMQELSRKIQEDGVLTYRIEEGIPIIILNKNAVQALRKSLRDGNLADARSKNETKYQSHRSINMPERSTSGCPASYTDMTPIAGGTMEADIEKIVTRFGYEDVIQPDGRVTFEKSGIEYAMGYLASLADNLQTAYEATKR